MHTILARALVMAVIVTPGLPDLSTQKTWILLIEGEAASLTVTRATQKNFAFRAPRKLESEYRIRLVDALGKTLHTVPLDLSNFCLDPAHKGQKPHVRGDVVFDHKVSINVKVPGDDGFAVLHIEKVTTPDSGGEPTIRTLGTITKKNLSTLLSATAAKPKVGTEKSNTGQPNRGESNTRQSSTGKPSTGKPSTGKPSTGKPSSRKNAAKPAKETKR